MFNKARVRCSTKQGNPRVARQMEAAHRTRLAKGEVGIVAPAIVPSLREFAPRFEAAMEVHCAHKPRTLKFWNEKLRRLLEFEPLASSKLDAIGPAMIANYVECVRHRQISRNGKAVTKTISPATINRELATLRRVLRLAHEWNVIAGVPRVRMLRGERCREFVLSHEEEVQYLSRTPQPLRDVALLILDTGLRVGEALALNWADVHLEPAHGARYGYLRVTEGKSKNAVRNLSLSARTSEMLSERNHLVNSQYVFPGRSDKPFVVTSLCHQHAIVRRQMKLSSEFVIHSLRHTMLTRLGEAGTDSFTIKRIAGHSSVTVSERYVHPTPEGLERAFEKLERLNAAAHEKISDRLETQKGQVAPSNAEHLLYEQAVPTISTTVN